jgi:tetratricopeptide (TPR) repeat protein
MADRFIRHASEEDLKEPDLYVGEAPLREDSGRLAGSGAAELSPESADLDEPAPPPVETIRAVEHTGPTVETTNAALARTLAAMTAAPTAGAYRLAGAEYRRLGVFDRARTYLGRAIDLDPRDGAAFEERARVWRDEGWPAIALGDAHRAVSYAPESASAHNTLGTVRYSLGDLDGARIAFERALALDPAAAWAHSNLCYLAHLRGDDGAAVRHCERAIALAPDLSAAHNNLGLVHAASGRRAEALAAFTRAGGRAAGLYNLGIVHLARREYGEAVDAFTAALAEAPEMFDAWRRAKEARALAGGAGDSSTGAGNHAARPKH